MAYFHENALRKAVASLRLLGHRDDSKFRSSQEIGASAGGLMSGIPGLMKAKGKPQGSQQPQPDAPDYSNVDPEDVKAIQGSDSPFRQDVEFIKGNAEGSPVHSAEYEQEQFFRNRPQANPFEVAEAQQKMGDAAQMAPIGGVYTPEGMAAHRKRTNDINADFNTSRKLINYGTMLNKRQAGMGGSWNPEDL